MWFYTSIVIPSIRSVTMVTYKLYSDELPYTAPNNVSKHTYCCKTLCYDLKNKVSIGAQDLFYLLELLHEPGHYYLCM